MKKVIFIIIVLAIIVASCKVSEPVLKKDAYKGMYDEGPKTVLIMPPINRSTKVEAKDYFHTTLAVPLANMGFYPIPTFMSMEILKRESAYDAELFLEAPLNKFGEVFDADVALFTIIHDWRKSGLAGQIVVDIEYILKSTKTNNILWTRRGEIIYDTSVSSSGGGAIGALAAMAATAIKTATTDYIFVARDCNAYTFSDIPVGEYHEKSKSDTSEVAGLASFRVTLSR